MMPQPCALSSPMTVNRRSTSRSVSEAVGSSMMTIFASAPMALAISTICCSGMLSVSTRRAGSIEAPIRPQELRRPALACRPVEPPPRAAGFERHRDVLGDRQVGEERRLLVDGGDAERAGAAGIHRRHDVAVDDELAAIRRLGAGDDLDEGGFPRAVLADEGVHFARTEIEGHPLEGADAGKRFGDGGRGQQHVWLGDSTAATIQPACSRRQDPGTARKCSASEIRGVAVRPLALWRSDPV